jgi:hypothetical protein
MPLVTDLCSNIFKIKFVTKEIGFIILFENLKQKREYYCDCIFGMALQQTLIKRKSIFEKKILLLFSFHFILHFTLNYNKGRETIIQIDESKTTQFIKIICSQSKENYSQTIQE